MKTQRHDVDFSLIFWAGLGVFASLILTFLVRHYQPQNRVVSATPIEVEKSSPLTFVPNIVVSSEVSSDGTKELKMKVTTNQDETKTYEFSVTSESSANEQVVLRKTLVSGKRMTIPFNTWSPDNKYFFVTEHDDTGETVKVFKESGDPFETGEGYLDPVALFNERAIKNNFSEATGWASPTLILINTTTPEGTKGPTYWFEVPSKALIQLSTQF